MPERSYIFNNCDKLMYSLADLLGITYEQSCVYFNIWFTDIIVLVITILPIVYIIKKGLSKLWMFPSVLWLWVVSCFYVPEMITYSNISVMEQFDAGVKCCLNTNSQSHYEHATLIKYAMLPLILTSVPIFQIIFMNIWNPKNKKGE